QPGCTGMGIDAAGIQRRMIRNALILIALAAVVTGVAVAAVGRETVVQYTTADGPVSGVRPTAVGLPDVGASGTVGAGDITTALRTYHDSGQYEDDLVAVAGAAKAYLDKRVRDAAHLTGKPAIVLDIDETSLSNYTGIAATNFS